MERGHRAGGSYGNESVGGECLARKASCPSVWTITCDTHNNELSLFEGLVVFSIGAGIICAALYFLVLMHGVFFGSEQPPVTDAIGDIELLDDTATGFLGVDEKEEEEEPEILSFDEA